jgi:hypothetical protein
MNKRPHTVFVLRTVHGVDYEIHKPGCRDLAKHPHHEQSFTLDVVGTTAEAIAHEVNLDLCVDFASDYGQTPEEYIADCGGEQMNIRVLPCAVRVDS